jgi:type IV secretion system protein VirB5
MIFKRAVQRYGQTPRAETPYQRAAQVWDERIGSARVQANNWRLMAFGTLTLSTAMAGTLIWQSLQSRITPYVVEVDHLGEARAVKPAEAGFVPTDPQIAWHLARFIEKVRSISLDPVLMRRDWLSAYDFTTERGRASWGTMPAPAIPSLISASGPSRCRLPASCAPRTALFKSNGPRRPMSEAVRTAPRTGPAF